MRIITQRDLIKVVAERWRNTYQPFTGDAMPVFSHHHGVAHGGKTKRQIAEELDTLDPETATASDVNNIIGNKSWTRIECGHCGKETDRAVTFGCYHHTATLCKKCAEKCSQAFKEGWDEREQRLQECPSSHSPQL